MRVLPVTVVIPARDRESLIAATIASAQAQVPAPAEIIVIDDGSTDATKQIAASMGVRIICHDVAEGPGAARNTGIAAATNDWIAFLDSDDIWFSGHLAALWRSRTESILRGEQLSFVANAALVFGNVNSEPVLFGFPGPDQRRYESPKDAFLGGNSFTTSGVLVNRDAIIKCGGFGEQGLCEDLDTWIRLLTVGIGLANPYIGFGYRKHEDNVSADKHALYEASVSVINAYAGNAWFKETFVRGLDMTYAWSPFRKLSFSTSIRDVMFALNHLELLRPLMLLSFIRRRTKRMSISAKVKQRSSEWESFNAEATSVDLSELSA